MNSRFKKGDLVMTVENTNILKESHQHTVGVLLGIKKQPDGTDHHVLWVDSNGCFDMWHYKNAIVHYNKGEQSGKNEEKNG